MSTTGASTHGRVFGFRFDLTGPDGGIVPAADLHRAHLATLHAEFGIVVTTDDVIASITTTD